MKRLLLSLLFSSLALLGMAQIPSYYNNVNLNATGSSLKNALSNKVTSSQTNGISYTPGVWNALRQTDLDPNNSSNVILIYGYSNNDGNRSTDRTRSKYSSGGGSNDWNREHVYPRSLGTPNLGSSGPGSDPHHIRCADVNRNALRGSRKFAAGSGNSRVTSQGHWYPGDEFKGDVARMIMFMYLRYGNRCLPSNVGVGSRVSNDQNMLQLFLQWNADDPVSALELQRNQIVQNLQGNRNPFIDNPAFATQIWGGPQAEDRFGTGGNNGGGSNPPSNIDVRLTITFDNYPEETSWEITNSSNQVVHAGGNYGNQSDGSTITLNRSLAPGCYTLTFRDSYGDGMCCAYGNGSFRFTNLATGNTITSGGAFNSVDSKNFCVGNTSNRLYNANTPENTVEITEQVPFEVQLYPNPVQDVLYLKLQAKGETRYVVVNQMGQVVLEGLITEQQISVQELSAGVYWVRFWNESGQELAKKLIKQ